MQPGVTEACETTLKVRLMRDVRNGTFEFNNKYSINCKSNQLLLKKLVCPFSYDTVRGTK